MPPVSVAYAVAVNVSAGGAATDAEDATAGLFDVVEAANAIPPVSVAHAVAIKIGAGGDAAGVKDTLPGLFDIKEERAVIAFVGTGCGVERPLPLDGVVVLATCLWIVVGRDGVGSA
jgi:hypothetical protein